MIRVATLIWPHTDPAKPVIVNNPPDAYSGQQAELSTFREFPKRGISPS